MLPADRPRCVSSVVASGPDRAGLHDLATGTDGNLWFTYAGATIGRLTPLGVVTTFTAPTVHAPHDITSAPDGTLWFTDQGDDSIGSITTAGVISHFDAAAIEGPTALTPGPDGNVWFTNTNDTIGRITPAGVVTTRSDVGTVAPGAIVNAPEVGVSFATRQGAITRINVDGTVSTTPGGSVLQRLAVGADGNIWFTDTANESIGRLTPAGVVTNYTSRAIGRYTPAGVQTMFAVPGNLAPVALVPGPDGALWFTTFSNNIGRITTGGAVTLFPGSGFQFGGSIAIGADGNAWFTTAGADAIGRITMGGVISTFTGPGVHQPHSLAAGPDGNLWFTNAADNTIGRITTGGSVVTFADPTLSTPTSITRGPDDDLWFTNLGSNSIGKISSADVPGVPTGSVAVAADRAAAVTWTAPTATGGAPVIGYLVTAAPGGRTCTWTSGPTSCVVTGLTNGTSYTFTITATNAHGTSSPSPATPAIAASAFDDVAPASPFFDDIDWLVHRGITTGTAPRQFAPGADVSRQALAAFLYRYNGSPLGAHPTCAAPPFTDVPTSAPFCGEIAWLARYGIAAGYPDGSFHPGDVVSRQAMAAFLYRLAGRPDGATPTCSSAPFADMSATDTFCGEIRWAATHGIALGFPDGTFRRRDPVSRQAMAAFLHRLSLLPG